MPSLSDRPLKYDTNTSSVHVVGEGETSTTSHTSSQVMNNPYPFMDAEVWEWMVGQGLYGVAEALGDTVDDLVEEHRFNEEKVRVHFSYDGDVFYAIISRLPVAVTGAERYEYIGEIESEFYTSLEERLSMPQFVWLREKVSLAFLPG